MDALLYKFFSALSQGCAFLFFTVGIAVAFRWIKFPDLTGDGSFTLGGVVTARLVSEGWSVWLAMPIAVIAGFAAGCGTYAMHRYLRVPKILAGVLMMMGLYTINLRILGRPNLQFPREAGILGFLPSASGKEWAFHAFLLFSAFAFIALLILYAFLESRLGLVMRVCGANPRMASMHGIAPTKLFLGLGMANALIAFSGALIAQRSYNADILMGAGQVVVAVAALFIGMVLFRRASSAQILAAATVGSLIYMILMQAALEVGVQAQDFRLISTLIVLGAIFVASLRGRGEALRKGADAFGIDG